MAKPLGPKSKLIRDAITANPGKGNKALADMLNSDEERQADKIKVTPNDVAQQRQAMKKAGAAKPEPAKAASKPAVNGRKKGGRKAGAPESAKAASTSAQASPIDLLDKTLDLARQCGGVAALKRLVDRLADMQK